MTDSKGFTSIEAGIVLGIVSIIAAIAYPSLLSLKQRICFQSEGSTLVAWLHRAKSEAVKRNSYVVINSDSQGYSIFVDNSSNPTKAGDWIRENDEQKLVVHRLKNGLRLLSNFTKNRTRFGVRPGIKAGTFTLKDFAGHSMKVIVSVIGRIRVE